jgi:hypothetical protein
LAWVSNWSDAPPLFLPIHRRPQRQCGFRSALHALNSGRPSVSATGLPRLPAIDSPSRECQASQLQASKLPTLDGGKWHAALIYNLTNISSQTCRLGGAPQLSFVHPAGKSYSAIPSACPNCADCSFPAAPERLDRSETDRVRSFHRWGKLLPARLRPMAPDMRHRGNSGVETNRRKPGDVDAIWRWHLRPGQHQRVARGQVP